MSEKDFLLIQSISIGIKIFSFLFCETSSRQLPQKAIVKRFDIAIMKKQAIMFYNNTNKTNKKYLGNYKIYQTVRLLMKRKTHVECKSLGFQISYQVVKFLTKTKIFCCFIFFFKFWCVPFGYLYLFFIQCNSQHRLHSIQYTAPAGIEPRTSALATRQWLLAFI